MSRKKDDKTDFKGYDEPLGAIVDFLGEDTIRTRLATAFFKKEMFRYFSELSSGQTGWGISYKDWLEINGWKLQHNKMQRISSY